MGVLRRFAISAVLVRAVLPFPCAADEPVVESRRERGAAPPIISIRLEDTDIRSALRVFAEMLRLNIVARREVVGRVRSLRLDDVPADEAFNAMLRTMGLEAAREGGVVIVYPIEVLLAEQQKRLELKRLNPE